MIGFETLVEPVNISDHVIGLKKKLVSKRAGHTPNREAQVHCFIPNITGHSPNI